MSELYNCKSISANEFRITKFDRDLNVISSYALSREACECPAGARSTCRHRQMLPKFLQRKQVDTDWFYDFLAQGWVHLALLAPSDVELAAPPESRESFRNSNPSDPASATAGATALNSAEREGEVTHPSAVADPVPTPKLNRRGL
jgi:hypothetical protein